MEPEQRVYSTKPLKVSDHLSHADLEPLWVEDIGQAYLKDAQLD